MGDAIGQMLPSAVGIAISPLPLIAVILMLATPRGRTNGIAFAAGWTLSLAAATTVLVLVGSGAGANASGADGTPATWTSWLELVLGTLFVLLAARQFTGRPREGHQAQQPAWMKSIDHFTPAKAVGLAAVLAVANPKNLVLVIAGALAVAGSTGGTGGKTLAVVLMVLIASLCTTLPLAVYLLGGTRSVTILGDWKAWMSAHNAAIMTTVLAVLGAKYIGDAISGLVT